MCLYVGIPPEQTLPVLLDVGTDNAKFLEDPLYIGLRHKRVRDQRYDDLVLEFMTAARDLFGEDCILQFEDFGNRNAFRLLETHRNNFNTFNDDIQGTAAVVLAGIYSAIRTSRVPLHENKFLFVGAGSAGLGVGQLIATATSIEHKLPVEQCQGQMWYTDSRGLIFRGRGGKLSAEKAPFAHAIDTTGVDTKDLAAVVRLLRPTAIIGVSAKGGVFTAEVLRLMGEFNQRPIIFPLSNPTSQSECTAEEAYTATQGRCLFASGSPFAPVTIKTARSDGKKVKVTLAPGQGNNSYIFPGLSLGVMIARARRIPDTLFISAARALASLVSDHHRLSGNLYPDLSIIGDASVHVAAAVAERAYELGIASNVPKPADLIAYIREFQYKPEYPSAPMARL
jgi:malic enzyme